MKIEILLSSISVIGSVASIWAAIVSFNEKTQVVKFKKEIDKRFKLLEHNDIYIEAHGVSKIIIKYKTKKVIGSNKASDDSKILSFITRIKEYSYLLQNEVANEYFDKMEKAINSQDYSTMYLVHSDLIQKLRTEKRSEIFG